MSLRRKKSGSLLFICVAAVVLLTVLSCLAVAHRDQILVEYHAAMFVDPVTDNPDSHAWLIAHPLLSVPVLVSKLTCNEPAICERAGSLIGEIRRSHPDPTDPEHALLSLNLASLLQHRYADFSAAGRMQAIQLAYGVLEQHLARWSPNVATALTTAGQVVRSGLWDPSMPIQEVALAGLPAAWQWQGSDNVAHALVGEWMYLCNKRAVELLHSDSSAVRASAALALNGAIDHSGDPKLLKLLDDPEPAVLKAALQTISVSAVDSLGAIHRRKLLEFLDNPDEEIRTLARKILVESGLTEGRLRLASLQRNKLPEERAKVATEVFEIGDVDRVSIINELAKDSSPIVRRAAVEAAAKIKNPTMRDLLKHLGADDPDPDVRKACSTALETPTADVRD